MRMRPLTFEYKNDLYRISFSHKLYESEALTQHFKGKTKCFIHRLPLDRTEPQELVASGASLCSTLDSFDKEKGRRISLKRAVEDWVPRADKYAREAIWKSYFSRVEN